jgi:hypothetical protein
MHKAIFLFWAMFTFSQNAPNDENMLYFDTPMQSPCLCGKVRLEFSGGNDDGGVEGFLIREVTPDLEQVIQSTYSDKNGLFKLQKISNAANTHYICVSNKPLYLTACYKVKVSQKAKKKLDIKVRFR